MGNREELLKEREKLKELEDIMRKEAEAIFKDFRPKYQYKVTKIDPDKRELIFNRGDIINTIIKVDIRPSPGVVHECTGLNLKARKIAPYMRLNIPVLYNVEHKFLVDKEGHIIPHGKSYSDYDLTLTARSMCIEPVMRTWIPALQEGENEKIEIYARLHNDRVIKIETWIKMGYPDGELVWTEELGEIVRKES